MSYILSGSASPIFSLRSLLVAPMLQSQTLVSVNPDGNVQAVVSYQGLQVDTPDNELPDDIEMPKADVRQQYAVFEVIQSGILDHHPGDIIRIALTEQALENEMYAFIPRSIKPTEADVKEE